MEPTIFDQLDRDWEIVSASRSASRRLTSWGDEALASFSDPGRLVEVVQGSRDPIESDRLLAALASRCRTDDLAARTLLQCLLPGARSIARSYQQLGSRDEVASMVVSVLTEKIRSYPFERRPERIAANLLNDTRHVLYDETRSHARLVEAVGPVLSFEADIPNVEARVERHPVNEVLAVVQQAVELGAIDTRAASVVVGHRVFDVPLGDFRELDGLADDTRRRYRLRAERSIADSAREFGIGH